MGGSSIEVRGPWDRQTLDRLVSDLEHIRTICYRVGLTDTAKAVDALPSIRIEGD